MRRASRKNLQQLKNDILTNIVNKELLEKSLILLRELDTVESKSSNNVFIHNHNVSVDSYECYSKRMDKKVIFDFNKKNKNYFIRVLYNGAEENIEVYNDNKDIIVSKQKKLNNAQTFISFAKYVDNQLSSYVESINLDYNDPSLKKITNMKLVDNKGNKKVSITYDKEPITEYYYNIDFLNSNLQYHNVRSTNNEFGYSEKLIYDKEFVDCKDELNKKVLTRK